MYDSCMEYRQNYLEEFDSCLDKFKDSPKWLGKKILNETIHYRDNKDYELIAHTIMTKHVHIIFTPIVGRTDFSTNNVKEILKSLNWNTALKYYKVLNYSGTFWQHESYDHIIRDSKELDCIIHYVLNNLIKDGICET